jgi:hypothetical protein
MSAADEPYRFRVREGDYIRLPDKRTGTVSLVEVILGGHLIIVSIRLDKPKRRWLGLLPAIPLRLADDEIDRLEILATKEEFERLGKGG